MKSECPPALHPFLDRQTTASIRIEKRNSMEGVDLPQLLIQLRQCRMGIISTAQQLRYSYVAIVEGGKLLLSTPPEERPALVVCFPEHGKVCSGDGDDTSDSDDEADGEAEDEVELDIQDDEREILKHLRLRAAARGVSFQPNYLFAVDSSSSSTEDDDEVELVELLNQRHRKPHHLHNPHRGHQVGTAEFEEVHDSGVEESSTMPVGSPPAESNTNPEVTENTSTVSPNEPALPPSLDAEPSAEGDSDDGSDGEDGTSDEAEEEEAEAVHLQAAALEAIRQRHEARLARQAQTRARLAEISARMQAKDMLRRRWIPMRIAYPLRRWFVQSGHFNNLTEATLFSLGVFSLLVALAVGLWWQRIVIHCIVQPRTRDHLKGRGRATCDAHASIAPKGLLEVLPQAPMKSSFEDPCVRLAHYGDITEHNSNPVTFDGASHGTTRAYSSGASHYHIYDLERQRTRLIHKQTLSHMKATLGMTPGDAMERIKTSLSAATSPLDRNVRRLAPKSISSGQSTRLQRFVIRPREHPLVKIEAQRSEGNSLKESESAPLAADTTSQCGRSTTPIRRASNNSKVTRGVTLFPSLLKAVNPQGATERYESGDDHCTLSLTTSNISGMFQRGSQTSTCSLPRDFPSCLSTAMESGSYLGQSTPRDCTDGNYQSHVYPAANQLPDHLDVTKTSPIEVSDMLSPAVNTNSCTGSMLEYPHKQHAVCSKTVVVIDDTATGVGGANHVTAANGITGSDATPRQSAYKEPNGPNVHRKVHLAILVHPTATPSNYHGTPGGYHRGVLTNSINTSTTECNLNLTSSTFASEEITADQGSSVFDDQRTDVSEDYEDETIQPPEEALVDTGPIPVPRLSPISECTITTRPSSPVSQNNENCDLEGVDAIVKSPLCASPVVVECGVTRIQSPPQPVATRVLVEKPSEDVVTEEACTSISPVPWEAEKTSSLSEPVDSSVALQCLQGHWLPVVISQQLFASSREEVKVEPANEGSSDRIKACWVIPTIAAKTVLLNDGFFVAEVGGHLVCEECTISPPRRPQEVSVCAEGCAVAFHSPTSVFMPAVSLQCAEEVSTTDRWLRKRKKRAVLGEEPTSTEWAIKHTNLSTEGLGVVLVHTVPRVSSSETIRISLNQRACSPTGRTTIGLSMSTANQNNASLKISGLQEADIRIVLRRYSLTESKAE
ncbi:unnamed protein product [Mesocestoides corti]|uniref:protein-tyrosine-phosphatase n=2 Tax=Mesocestoides corti TaxID=53468 RepID=A0A3P6GCB0_MESCO|nr:unnamed protein product [Mesocestoides corti]